MHITLNKRTLLWALIFILAIAAQIFVFHLWLNTPPSKAGELSPLLKEINHYHATRGQYPKSIKIFSSFTNLTQRHSVYTGEQTTNGVTWQPYDVSNHDFTVMIAPDGYEIFLPVGHMKMISFSSFAVWRLDSNERRWRKGRIHWSLIGGYWSDD